MCVLVVAAMCVPVHVRACVCAAVVGVILLPGNKPQIDKGRAI